MNPSYRLAFGRSVQMCMWGPGGSRKNYSAVTGNYVDGVEAAEKFFRAPIKILRVGFKNPELVDFGALRPPDSWQVVGNRRSVRMERIADVAFAPIDPENPQPVVMAMMNADCPAVFAVEHDDRGREIGCWFAHAGLECLVPKEPANRYSVIETIWSARQSKGFRGRIEFYLSGGIGPCCYGLENVDDLRVRLSLRYGPEYEEILKTATKGPRRGSPSVDLKEVYMREVARAFFEISSVTFIADGHCTACLGLPGIRTLWSNVYDGGSEKVPLNPRNFLCWAWTPPPPTPRRPWLS
jgi:hypothetical protein